MIAANHEFQRRGLNVLDENGNEGCAACGRPRSVHPADMTPGFAGLSYSRQNFAGDPAAAVTPAVTPGPDPVHLMTIEMGCWCGASGPGNGRASSAWREVTCTACLAKGATQLRALVWDLLDAMPPSREALGFVLRAGRLGVTDEQGHPLAMACAPGNNSARDTVHDDAAERADVLRMRREMAREAGDDSPGADLDDGRHPDECPCQFCEEDRREAAAQDDGEDEADYAPASPAFIAGPVHDPQWSEG